MDLKVSIVIPVYNGSNYMRDAIDSALNQTYKNCEVIVVNDGSTDNGATAHIAKSYGNKIRYFEKENGGVATAVNFGIQKMTGEYFAWLSHDDMFTQDKIEKQMKALIESGQENAIVHSNFEFLYVEKNETVEVDWLQQYTKEQLEDSCFAPVFLAIHGSTVLIHKSHFERVGMYDTSLKATQDSEFLFRVMRNQKSLFVEENLMISRIHKEQGQQTMPCHSSEYNEMFINFCELLTDSEKEAFCGSVLNFYCRLYLLLKHSRPANSILTYLKEKINFYMSARDEEDKVLIKLKANWKNRGIKEIYIFGAGQMGKEMHGILKSYGIEIAGFVDNAKEKQGKLINGIKCISPDYLANKEEYLVIISMMNTEAVKKQLNDLRIKNVSTIGLMKKILFFTVPKDFIC